MHACKRLALSRRLFSTSLRICSDSSSLRMPLPPPPPAVLARGKENTSEDPPFHASKTTPRFNATNKKNEIRDFMTLVDSSSSTTSSCSASGLLSVKVTEPPEQKDGKPKLSSLEVAGMISEWAVTHSKPRKGPRLKPGQTPHQSGKNRRTRQMEAFREKTEKRKRKKAFLEQEKIRRMKEQGIEYVPPKKIYTVPLEQKYGIDTTGMNGKDMRRLRRRLRRKEAKVKEEKKKTIASEEQQRAVERGEREKMTKQEAKEIKAAGKKTTIETIKTVPKGEWMGEEWTGGWGEDKLAPPPSHFPAASINVAHPVPDKSSTHNTPPHLAPPPVYDQKIEGLLLLSTSAVSDVTNPGTETKPILEDLEPKSEHNPVAKLAHGLDRVLFNPGVHWLQDPRSRVYNFDPYLENIPKVTDFAFERLVGFIRSSRDEDLWSLAKENDRPFAGSTSSLSGMLSHIYFLVSGDKPVNTSMLSKAFTWEAKNFTPGQRMPATVVFNHNEGRYAIDSSDKGDSEKNILTWMGTLLERFVTMPEEEFSTFLRKNPPPKQLENPLREAYRYSKSEKFVMRSQLDCHDARLPGTGVFDIKTRACLPIRMDLLNYEENAGYQIRMAQGLYESFEREYYDLIRSAFLKYGFQVRIGNMDGVIVAYHNTEKMFGFQYVPLEEMDEAVFGGFKLRMGARAVAQVQEKQERWERQVEEMGEAGADTGVRADDGPPVGPEPVSEGPLVDGKIAAEEDVESLRPAPDELLSAVEDRDWKRKQGDRIFEVCVKILEKVSQEVVNCFPGQSVQATFEKYEPVESSKWDTDHVLNVWVEPLDWKPEADRPLKQLEVRVTNYFGQEKVQGARAVTEGAGEDWSVHWSVGRLSGETINVRVALKNALARQFRAVCIPSGVQMENIKEWWEGLNFGNPTQKGTPTIVVETSDEAELIDSESAEAEGREEKEAEATALTTTREGSAEPPTAEEAEAEGNNGPQPEHKVFVYPPKRIQFLRSMARKGRVEVERIKKEEDILGRKKVVLGGDAQ